MDAQRENPLKPDGTPSYTEYYQIVRGQIEHEDDLITNRLNWFLSSQSFLFTAYAILGNGVLPSQTPTTDARHQLLVIIPGIAGATCLLIFIAIVSGFLAMHNLRSLFHQNATTSLSVDLPPLQGRRSTQLLGMAAPILLPILFMGVWAHLLMRHLF